MINNFIVYKINKIVHNELKKEYYENVAHVKEIIKIKDELVDESYYHIENLVIWQNGFFNFQKFNVTTPSLRKPKSKIIPFKKVKHN